MTATPSAAPPPAPTPPPVPGLPPPPSAPVSAVDVFRTRQSARRAIVVVFYRGERSRFCRTWLRRWLSVPALARRLRLADTALLFVSSQSQGKAYSVAAQSGVPEHLLDRLIYFLGDPAHGLAAHLERARLLAPVVTNPTGHRAHAWVYPNGMVQPAVVAAAADGRPLFAWAMQPSFRNAGGKLERPDPWDAWDYIEQKLDRARAGAIEPVPAIMPTVAPRGAGATARVAAAAADAAEAAAREGAPQAELPAMASRGSVDSVPPAPTPPKQPHFPLAPAFPDVPDEPDLLSLPVADIGTTTEAYLSAEGFPSLEEVVASGSGSSADRYPAIPQVQSGLSDLATAAMESNDASLSSIEAGKARVQFSLADPVVIEPRAARDSLRSDGTGPKTPDISLLQTGPAQFDDASPVSARSSAGNTAAAVAAEIAHEDREEMFPRTISSLERATGNGSDGPGSGRELIVDEFEVDEYIDDMDEMVDEVEPVAMMAPDVTAAAQSPGSATLKVRSASIEDRSAPASRNTVRNLIEKWAQLDAAQFGNIDPDAAPAMQPKAPPPAPVLEKDPLEGATEPETVSEVVPKSIESVEAMVVDAGSSSPFNSVPEGAEKEEMVKEEMMEVAPTPPEEVSTEAEGAVISSPSSVKPKEEVELVEETPKSVPGADIVDPATEEKKASTVEEVIEEAYTTGTSSDDVDENDVVEAVAAPVKIEAKDDVVSDSVGAAKENVPVHGNAQRELSTAEQGAVSGEGKADDERLKQLEKKAKKIEFLDSPVAKDDSGEKAETSAAAEIASAPRKLSASLFPAERQGGWFSQNIFSRLSKSSGDQPSFLQRRSLEQSPEFLRVPVGDDLEKDQGVLAIQRARDESAQAEATQPAGEKAKEALEEIPLNEERTTDGLGPAGRAKKALAAVRVRSLPRNMSGDGAEAGTSKADEDEAKLGRKRSLFSGRLNTEQGGAGPSRPRRHPFGRAGRSGGVPLADDDEGGPDRRTTGLGRGSRKVREDSDEAEATVRRKVSLAKISDAVLSKISVSYNQTPREGADVGGPETRRSSLRFTRGGTDGADLRRTNTNVGGPGASGSAREAGTATPQPQNAAGFGRRLWSRWAKTKS